MSYFAFIGVLYSFLFYTVQLRARHLKYDIKEALDISFVLMVFGFIGARLAHVFFESPEIYRQNWIWILHFWQGGFVFYGGAILAFLTATLFVHLKGLNVLKWADFFSPLIALGYGLGRISCFLAGCCYGKVCHLPWAVEGKHPTQIYAVLWELSLFVILVIFENKNLKKQIPKPNGHLFFIWMIGHALGRLIMEHFRDDFRGPTIIGLSISTFISIGLVLIGTFFLFKNKIFSFKK